MPKQINTHLPGQWLVTRFGLKGRYQPVLDETIVPVVEVQEASDVRPASCFIPNIPAKVGDSGFIRIANPALSGIEIVLEAISTTHASTEALVFSFGTFSIVGATLVTAVLGWRDSGLAGLPKAVILTGSDALASMPAGIFETYGFGTYQNVNEFRIQEGATMNIYGDTGNIAWSRTGLMWREITLNPTNI